MSDRFLEQRIDINFRVKLGKNATDTFKMLSEAYRGEGMEKSSVFECHKRFRESSHVEITNEDNAYHVLRYQDIVHCGFDSKGQTVYQAHYVEMLKQLREAVHRQRPELCPSDWILHHDNAPAHKALSVKQFLAQKPITEMDLALNDFWLFPKIKSALKG
jgi:hypothetical protein